MKHLFFLSLTFLLCYCSTEKNTQKSSWKIDGVVENLDVDYAYLFYSVDGEDYQDSSKVDNGAFVFEGATWEKPVRSNLNLYTADKSISHVVFLQGGDITVKADPTLDLPFSVAGSPLNDEFQNYFALYGKMEKEASAKINIYYEGEEKGEDVSELEKELDDLFRDISKIKTDFITNNLTSKIAPYEMLDNFFYFKNDENLERYFEELSEDGKASYAGQKLKTKIENTLKSGIGRVAADITLPGTDGNTISLSNYRGKYVLIDFWATWCAPCVAEFPHLKKVYEKNKDKNFEIFGVSLDADEEAWADYLAENNIGWVNVLDDVKTNAAAEAFAVEAVPSKFLLDPEGVIVDINLQGDALDDKLAELLN